MRLLLVSATLLLTACGDEAPPAPTASEAEQLNEAENLLNQEAQLAEPAGEQTVTE